MVSFSHELIQYVYSYQFLEKNLVAKLTFECFLSLMNCCKMPIQIRFLRGTVDKDYTWMASFFHELMQHVDLCMIYLSFYNHKALIWMNSLISKLTFEYFLSIMNCCKMPIQIRVLRETMLTKITLAWLLFFMNWCNMLIHVWFS